MLKTLKQIIKNKSTGKTIDFEPIEKKVLSFLDFVRLNYNPFFGDWLRLSDKRVISTETILRDYDKERGLV